MQSIDRKLRKLEMARAPSEEGGCQGLAFVWHWIPRERKQNLAPGERVVVDWYRSVPGMLLGRERIATDPADQGRKCFRNGYLLDVLTEIHHQCAYRERTGSCRYCHGTPIAEEFP
jgi:hypothetical protein